MDAIVFLCTQKELTREREGYFKAFSKIIKTICISNSEAQEHHELQEIIPSGVNIKLILDVDSFPRILPHGLSAIPIPTACFKIDTYEQTQKHLNASMLFDYAFVFHPGYEVKFQKAGHPRAICLPHAVDASLFEGEELERIYDVGWVGRTDLKFYSFRRRCIERLRASFKMNDPNRYYTPQEMALVYRQSKIVVNLSRDDYLQDANLRCFEALAAGALLVTPKPTELSELGFVEGVHYISFQSETEINQLVQFYLDNELKRQEIALAGKNLVMEKHTYDYRAKTILGIVAEDNGQLFSPARTWSSTDVQAIYVQYFADYLMIDSALRELGLLRGASQLMALRATLIVLKAFLKKLRWSIL